MFGDGKAALGGDQVLALLDFRIVKFFNFPAIDADQMVMVRTLVQLKYSLTCFEVITVQNLRLFELREDAIHGGESDIHVVVQQDLVDILGGEVAYGAVLKDFQNFQTRQGRLEAA